MKKTPLKRGNSILLKNNHACALKRTSTLKKNPQKMIKKQIVNIQDLYNNLDFYIESHDWNNLRKIGLNIFSNVVYIIAKGKCQRCGKKGTDAHHWCYTKSSNCITDIMPLNGILLCRKCHSEAHENFTLFKEKIPTLSRYVDSVEYLKNFRNKPVTPDDFSLVEEIIRTGIKIEEENKELLKKKKGKSNGTEH